MSSSKSCSLIHLKKKAPPSRASGPGRLRLSETLKKRAVAESHTSSDFVTIESKVFRAAFLALELSPSSWTRIRS